MIGLATQMGMYQATATGGGGGAYYDEQAADSPVARWKAPGSGTTWIDDVGGLNGTATGGVTLGAGDPYGGNLAATFDGTSAHVGVPYNALLAPLSALTVEIWAYRASWVGGVSGIGPNKTEAGGYGLWHSLTTPNGVSFYLRRNGGYGIPEEPVTLAAGWHHIVGTYDGRYSKLYIDGGLIDTDDAGANYSIQYTQNNTLQLGADPQASTSANNFFSGRIFGAAVYSTALSDSRIAAHYNSASA